MIILEAVAIFLMNRKKILAFEPKSFLHLFSVVPTQPTRDKKKNNTAEGQLKLRSVCQCRKRDICWRNLSALLTSS